MGAVRGAVTAGLSGGDIAAGALGGAATQGIGAAIGELGISDALGNTALGATGAHLLTNALSGAANAAVRGKDVEAGAASGLTSGLFNWAANGFSNTVNNVGEFLKSNAPQDETNRALQEELSQLSSTGEQFNAVAQEFTATQSQARDAYEQYNQVAEDFNAKMQPAVQELQSTSGIYNDFVDQYQAAVGDFDRLKAEYDAAVEREDLEGANALAKEANDAAARASDLYTQLEGAKGNYLNATEAYNALKGEHSGLLDQAGALREQYDSAYAKLQELNTKGQELQTNVESQKAALQENVARYTTALDQKALAGATQVIEEQESPYAPFMGTQTFDDGSSMEVFDDGSMRVTDSEGGVQTYDNEGNVFDSAGNPATESQSGSKARDYRGVFSQLMAASRQAPSAGTRTPIPRQSNAAAGRRAPGAAGAAGALPAPGTEGAFETGADPLGSTSAAPSEEPSTTKPYNPYAFLDEGASKLTYIPGVSEALGFKGSAPAQNLLTITGGATGAGGAGMPPANPYSWQAGSAQKEAADEAAFDPFAYPGAQVGTSPSAKPGTPSDVSFLSLDPLALSAAQNPYRFGPFAAGGSVFMSEGGQRYVGSGEELGDGTSDEVDAKLSAGEFVIPADVVSALGNGDNQSGAGVLDRFIEKIRMHKQENGTKLPPDAKDPLDYLSLKGA